MPARPRCRIAAARAAAAARHCRKARLSRGWRRRPVALRSASRRPAAAAASAAHARHATNFHPPELATLERLLSPAQLKRARALGATIRLACDLSGRSPSLLAHARLSLDKTSLMLAADPGFADLLLGEQTNKRANTAAQHLGLKPKIVSG